MNLEDFSAVGISTTKKSHKARDHILPNLRKNASIVLRTYSIEIRAFGKDSVPVRIAELTCGAHAIRYVAEKVAKENVKLKLGLPTRCQTKILKDKVALLSLIPTENEVAGYAEVSRDILENVKIEELLNPCVRCIEMLEIAPL